MKVYIVIENYEIEAGCGCCTKNISKYVTAFDTEEKANLFVALNAKTTFDYSVITEEI